MLLLFHFSFFFGKQTWLRINCVESFSLSFQWKSPYGCHERNIYIVNFWSLPKGWPYDPNLIWIKETISNYVSLIVKLPSIAIYLLSLTVYNPSNLEMKLHRLNLTRLFYLNWVIIIRKRHLIKWFINPFQLKLI